MTFPAYSRYRDSGVEWLSEVPDHWAIKAFRRVIQKSLSNGIFKKKEDFGRGILLVNVFDVYRRDFTVDYLSLDRVECSAAEVDSYAVAAGDLFFVRSSLKYEGISVVAVAGNCPETVVYECHLIRARPDPAVFDGRYGSYLFNSNVYRAIMISKAKLTTMTTIDQDAISSTLIPVPPLFEQIQIARFLDHEIACIDGLIEEQQRLIELLKEKRQAVISHAVTKGLDPAVPMKYSGVEWLGEVPAHWTVKLSKYLFEFVTSGSRGWAEFYTDEGEFFFRITNLTRDSIEPKLESIKYVTLPENSEGVRAKVRLGDILISITADLGSVCVANEEVSDSYVSQHVALARPFHGLVFSRWIGYCVLSTPTKEQLIGVGYGGTKVQLSLEDIKSFLVASPPYSEQVAIAEFLDGEINNFDLLIRQALAGVSLLAERRSALISAAVSGKIDVRGWQPLGSAQAPELELEAV